ncbi:MAG: DNA polymerase III subunit epsilon [SAR86 cluster bacterium]|uniref:DNA polymerase III subunit epsilon n=1 Tax=SAR86 cluster bacterium TaxID=2030880 RepID=A0A2A5BAA9_9GAMM|nr:MAG: DNA polymerase III subunit epsilon [SAR86 cluster bacterium]
MRQIVLDTETTGLDPAQGHRIIEIGCVEIDNRKLTGQHFQCFLNPDREIDQAAFEVHGISQQFLADKPRFAQVEDEFIAFVKGAQLIIHNAPFDIGFLNHELKGTGTATGVMTDFCTVLDSLLLAREKHPGQRNSLDALCKRYEVDNTQRQLHGALLDAEILADVYLAMTSGQESLLLDDEQANDFRGHQRIRTFDANRSSIMVVQASSNELKAHQSRLDAIESKSEDGCLWLQLETEQ